MLETSDPPTAPSKSPSLPTLPELTDSVSYLRWRAVCLEDLGCSREYLANILEQSGSGIAFVRASMILATIESERARAYRLASRALSATDRATYLLAKLQCAYLTTLNGYSGDDQPLLTADSIIIVLEPFLHDIQQSLERSNLLLEVEVRVHHALAEAHILARDYQQAKRHAAEVVLLAPAVGLDHFVWNAKYQLGNIAYYEGDLIAASQEYNSVLDSEVTPATLIRDSSLARALALHWLGNDTAALETLDALELPSENPALDYATCVRLLSLRHPSFSEQSIESLSIPNSIKPLIRCYSRMLAAQDLSPDQDAEARDLYRNAHREVYQLRNSDGWRRTHYQALEAFLSLRSGQIGLARHALPEADSLLASPPTARAFGHAVAIEVAANLLPRESGLLIESADHLLEIIGKLEPGVDAQLSRWLQVLLPLATAIAGRFPGAPSPLANAGAEATMNFRRRPIKVYDTAGLRPMQAAKLTLTAFARSPPPVSKPGGGQTDSLRRVLYRTYFQRQCWFTPISPAKIVHALIAARDHMQTRVPLRSEDFQRAAQETHQHFGLIPKLQQTERLHELEELEQILTLGLQRAIDPASFHHRLGQEEDHA